jgi:hypothetical protein
MMMMMICMQVPSIEEQLILSRLLGCCALWSCKWAPAFGGTYCVLLHGWTSALKVEEAACYFETWVHSYNTLNSRKLKPPLRSLARTLRESGC